MAGARSARLRMARQTIYYVRLAGGFRKREPPLRGALHGNFIDRQCCQRKRKHAKESSRSLQVVALGDPLIEFGKRQFGLNFRQVDDGLDPFVFLGCKATLRLATIGRHPQPIQLYQEQDLERRDRQIGIAFLPEIGSTG